MGRVYYPANFGDLSCLDYYNILVKGAIDERISGSGISEGSEIVNCVFPHMLNKPEMLGIRFGEYLVEKWNKDGRFNLYLCYKPPADTMILGRELTKVFPLSNVMGNLFEKSLEQFFEERFR